MNKDYIELKVNKVLPKTTVYLYLKSLGYSENYIKNLRKKIGYILLNNTNAFTNSIIKKNDIIKISTNPNPSNSIIKCVIPLDIVFEDEYIIIINKPAGLSSTPTNAHINNNLAGAISYYMSKKCDDFVCRITNRLDKDTSGLVLIAKNSLIANYFNNNKVNKEYYAVVHGIIDTNLVIDKNIVTDYVNNKAIMKRRTDEILGKKSITHISPIKSMYNLTLVKITLDTGRTHQIRVHLSSIGHPLVGDEIYGSNSDSISHTALVCFHMDFIHPISQKNICINIPIPDDIKTLL